MTAISRVGVGLLFGCLSLFASSAQASGDVKVSLCSDVEFKTCKKSFAPGENVFVRFTFQKPVAEVFRETLGFDSIPLSGKYVFLISKDIDTDPIVTEAGPMLVSRYNKQTTFDLVLQADQKMIDALDKPTADLEKKIPFNSLGTMGNASLRDQWMNAAAILKDGEQNWEVFLAFAAANDDQNFKLVGQGKFSYKLTAENRSKLASGMNFYDKQRFEKTPDDGVTTEIHKSNVGKIVFSTNKMLKDFSDTGALTADFATLSKGIYGRMYLKQSLRNYLADLGLGKDVSDVAYMSEIIIDGDTKRKVVEKLSQEEAHKLTSWSITLAPNVAGDIDDNRETTQKFVYLMSMQKPGKHTVKVRTYLSFDEKETELATGEFTVNVDAKSRDALAKAYGTKLPEKGLLKSEKGLDKQVKALVGKDIVGYRAPNVWEERKNNFDVVTHRVTIIVTGYKENGECRQGQFMIQQLKEAKGWGAASATVQEKLWYGTDPDLPCQNLSK